jgi:hypothetical protein
MPCEELKRLEEEQNQITKAQGMLRENRRFLESGEHHDMKKQLQQNALKLFSTIQAHKQTCPECKPNEKSVK